MYKDPVLVEWAQTFRRPSSANTYLSAIIRYCSHVGITPQQLADISLEAIEKQTEAYIFEHQGQLSPSFLNITYSAMKKFCLWQNKIKNFAQFKQIDFDKSSRVVHERAFLTPAQFRKLFDHADIREKCVLALYGVHGLRPALIPQLKIEDIMGWQNCITNNQIELSEYMWLMIKSDYRGNKARIQFPAILTNETADWISQHLNSRARDGEKLGGKTQLVHIPTKTAVSEIVRKVYKQIGFNGRPYLLRHYANKLMKKAYDDAELKEWCMGHKGSISAVYDHEHYLTEEEIADYNSTVHMDKMYVYQSGNTRIPKLQEAVAQQEQEVATLRTRLETSHATLLNQEDLIRRLQDNLKKHARAQEIDKLYKAMTSMKEELELRKKEELVAYVAAKAPDDKQLKEFMKIRRIGESILDDDDMQCLENLDRRWRYNSNEDYMKHGYLSTTQTERNSQSKESN